MELKTEVQLLVANHMKEVLTEKLKLDVHTVKFKQLSLKPSPRHQEDNSESLLIPCIQGAWH